MRFGSLAVAVAVLSALVGCTTEVTKDAATATQAAATQVNGLSNGEILYGYRCKGCHEPATPGAPDRKKLATYESREIVKAMRSGSMKVLSPGLSRHEMQEIAAFLATQGMNHAKN